MAVEAGFKRKVVAGFGWQALTKFGSQLMTWGSTLIVVRILSPHEYGLMATASIFVGFLLAITEFGLGAGLIQRNEVKSEEERAVFAFSLLLGVGSYCLIFMAAPYVAVFYEEPLVSDLIRVASLTLLVTSLRVIPLARLMRAMNFRHRAYADFIGSVAAAVSVLFAALNGWGVWSLVLAIIVNNTVTTGGYMMASHWRPYLGAGIVRALPIIRYGLHVTGSRLLYQFSGRSDKAIIGKTIGGESLGYYSLAFELAAMPLDKFAAIFNQVTMPTMARLRNEHTEAREMFIKIHKYLLLITFPAFVGLALVARDFVDIVLTEQWRPIVPVLQGLCLVNLFRISAAPMAASLNGRGKAKYVLIYNIVCAVVLPISFLIGSWYGLEGVMLAWLMVFPALYIILAKIQLTDLDITLGSFLLSAWPAVFSVLTMALCVSAFNIYTQDFNIFVRLTGAIGVGFLSYLSALVLLFRGGISEMSRNLALVRKGKL